MVKEIKPVLLQQLHTNPGVLSFSNRVAKELDKSFPSNKSHLFLLHAAQEELTANIPQYTGVCCFGRGRKSPTFKKPFFKPPSCSLKCQFLHSSSSEWIQLEAFYLTLSPWAFISQRWMNFQAVTWLHPSTWLSCLWVRTSQEWTQLETMCREGGSQQARDGTNPPSGGDGLHSCPRPQNPAVTVRRLALLSPPLHSWQGVFLLLFPLLLSWFRAQCLLVLQPKINSRHWESCSSDIQTEHCLRERNNVAQELLFHLLFPSGLILTRLHSHMDLQNLRVENYHQMHWDEIYLTLEPQTHTIPDLSSLRWHQIHCLLKKCPYLQTVQLEFSSSTAFTKGKAYEENRQICGWVHCGQKLCLHSWCLCSNQESCSLGSLSLIFWYIKKKN